MTSRTRTRSVSFAPTSQLILIHNDGKIDTERKWYSQEEEKEFKREMAKDVKRLRAAIVTPHPLQEDLIDCNGIEVYTLYSEDIRQRLHDMKRVHRHIALAAQHLFTPLELSQVLQQGSEYARQHALKLAALNEFSTSTMLH